MELEELFRIIDKITAADCQEAYVKFKDAVVSIKKTGGIRTGASMPAAAAPEGESPAVSSESRENDPGARKIVSPVTGVYYEAPEPGGAPFISVNESFRRNQVLCIIESMKLMNEIFASEDGVLIEKLVGNGDMVQTSQPLFLYRNL